MKVYPINEDQLAQLGTLRGLAGICFTFAGALFGFAVNVYKDLQIQGQVPPDVLAYWTAIRDASLVAAIALAVVGGFFFIRGQWRLHQIKGATKFDD